MLQFTHVQFKEEGDVQECNVLGGEGRGVTGGGVVGGGFGGWSWLWVPCHGAELAPQRVTSGCAVRRETGVSQSKRTKSPQV